MNKPTVVKLFLGSLLAIAGGLVVAFAATIAAYGDGTFMMNGPDVAGVHSTPLAWVMITLLVIGALAVMAGAFGQFVAWIAAVINTARLEDKTWFIVLLLTGLLSFGLIGMVAYLIAGPDGTMAARERPSATRRPLPIA
jgi:H+/Cl- antiporter ClcA